MKHKYLNCPTALLVQNLMKLGNCENEKLFFSPTFNRRNEIGFHKMLQDACVYVYNNGA